MMKRNLYSLFAVVLMIMIVFSCKQKEPISTHVNINPDLQVRVNQFSVTTFDSLKIDSFFVKHPDLSKYTDDVKLIYKGHNYHHIWFDEHGVLEFANSLYGKVKGIEKEGVLEVFPYTAEIEGIFESDYENGLNNDDTEIMITSMYLFYAEKVFKGIDDKTAAAAEWLLPKKQVAYNTLLDTLMKNSDLLVQNDSVLFNQYYKLRNVLEKYRAIRDNGGWDSIRLQPKFKSFKPGDTAHTIVEIRKRLFTTGDLAEDNQSNLYDDDLLLAVHKFQRRNGRAESKEITKSLVDRMNIPVERQIERIVVNMERWRWVSPELANAKEFVFVNIPSFMLQLNRNGVKVFQSPVVVGKTMSKTVIFSGNMSSVVFSPYWNLPTSIINSEVIPGMKKDKNYLAKHNMEWNNGQVRQKPGKNNSLGLVKFLFPNSNNIYLHDTPAKSLFAKDSRAFSHGCVRVGKPYDLAVEILKDDPEWTPQNIKAAMNSGSEKWVQLKEKIPVYIGYFTCFVNDEGEFNFYDDIYDMDDRLFEILTSADEQEKPV